MHQIHRPGLFLMLLSILTGCSGQTKNSNPNQQTNTPSINKLVGGGCDGCELMYIDIPTNISSVDTSAGWAEKGQKLLVTGTIFKHD